MENVLMNNEPHLNDSNSYSAPVEEHPAMEMEDSAAQAMGVWKPTRGHQRSTCRC